MIPSDRSLDQQAELAPGFLAQAWPHAREQAEAIELLGDSIHSILICGCGDSHHAAVSLEAALAAATGRQVRAAASMEAGRYLLPRHMNGSRGLLLIAISASGEVARTLEALELARQAGAQTLALTTQDSSSLALAAHHKLALPIPAIPEGPGLLSYLASLMLGYALAEAWAAPGPALGIGGAIQTVSDHMESWIAAETAGARSLADVADSSAPTVFLGSGPALGSAMFAAAKLIEAAGATARGQDVEEWAHLEYFCEPANQTWWLLSSAGRSTDREQELMGAAESIGRRVHISRWMEPVADAWLREMLAPLALWAGPAAFADRLMRNIGEHPFRGFGGGRSREEGGGPSRIRSSRRWADLEKSVRGIR